MATNQIDANSQTIAKASASSNVQTTANTQQSADQPASAAADIPAILVVVSIIVLSGVVAGWAAHLTSTDDANGKPRARQPYVLLGIMAAGCVPLFLSLVKSNLVENIFTANGGHPFEEYLVFTGLCLIAAFSARSFIESVSRRVLRDLENVKEEHEEMRQKVDATAELVDDQQAQPVEPQVQTEAVQVDAAQLRDISETERAALNAMTRTDFRTATGIAADTGIPRNRIGELLDSLSGKGLVERTISPATRGPRWKITPAGIASLSAGG